MNSGKITHFESNLEKAIANVLDSDANMQKENKILKNAIEAIRGEISEICALALAAENQVNTADKSGIEHSAVLRGMANNKLVALCQYVGGGYLNDSDKT